MKKIDMKKIGITIGILLLLIGNVDAEDSVVIENASNISIGDTMVDTNDSNAVENITLEEVVHDKNITSEEGMMPIEKKSSPGFGSIIVMIAFLSAIIFITRRR